MTRKKQSILIGIIGIAVMIFLVPAFAFAAASCSNCHTMHKQQAGEAMGDGGLDNVGNNQLLLYGTCLACHTGTNTGVYGDTPYVLDTGDPAATSLAGGNFWWVDTVDDAKGHNVTGINTLDAAMLAGTADIPGSTTTYDATSLVTCAGTYGCHGDRGTISDTNAMSGTHHNNVTGQIDTATTKGNSYRFLSGVKGFEDTLYEYAPTDSRHNEYFGVARTADVDPTLFSISALCAACHGDFHTGADVLDGGGTWSTDWIRHPTDLDTVAQTGEYAAYVWNTLAPIARVTAKAAPVATEDSGDTIVMCLSCHRAHGSAYDDLMRWDYASVCLEGTANAACGCFQCHTNKD